MTPAPHHHHLFWHWMSPVRTGIFTARTRSEAGMTGPATVVVGHLAADHQ